MDSIKKQTLLGLIGSSFLLGMSILFAHVADAQQVRQQNLISGQQNVNSGLQQRY